MSQLPINEGIPRFKANESRFDAFINASGYVSSEGIDVPGLSEVLYNISTFTQRGAWVTATAYAVKDLVSVSGTWYVALVAHTSGATFAGDEPTKWRVYQGVLMSDLIDDTTSQALGHKNTRSGSVATTVGERLDVEPINLWDVLSEVKRADLLAGTRIWIHDELNAITTDLPAYGGLITFFGKCKIDETVFLRKQGVRLIGYGPSNSDIEYVNAAGGTAFAGSDDDQLTITDCELANFTISGSAAGTSASIGVDMTTISYSKVDLAIQTRRVDGICIYGQGNNGSSPYYNEIKGSWFGGADSSQYGLVFAAGDWALGSSGPNANTIGPIIRAAGLKGMCDIQCGNGNQFNSMSGESINDFYFRFNYAATAIDTGTSSGSNGAVSFKDTAKTMTVNEYINYAVEITGGTGAGQVRIVGSNTATQFTLVTPWATVPDATSTYSVWKNRVSGNRVFGCRGEGLNTNNPDFIVALPGTQDCRFNGCFIDSLGSGLYVRDSSGAVDNKWFDGSVTCFTVPVENPGASASIELIPRNSIFGGHMYPEFVVEWVSVAINSASPGGTVTVYLDVGGTAFNTGSLITLIAQTLSTTEIAFAMPSSTQKFKVDGINKHLFLRLVTGAGFNVTADISVTYCVTVGC